MNNYLLRNKLTSLGVWNSGVYYLKGFIYCWIILTVYNY